MAVDDSGNLYVTGRSDGVDSGADYLTVKYNSAGDEIWVARYDGPAKYFDKAVAIAVDEQSNVYITGSSPDIDEDRNFNTDYTTIKYNSAGEEEWVARYDGPAHDWDRAIDIAVDGSGNVYVTGDSEDQVDQHSSIPDITTIKYNRHGGAEWVRRYDGPTGRDGAEALVLDAQGNVYVTGWSLGEQMGVDITTIKYTQDEYLNRQRTFNLSQSYPNPFNGSTTIRYRLENSSQVRLTIYNIMGQEIDTLIDDKQQAGEYEVAWHAKNAPSGTYVYRLHAKGLATSGGDFSDVRKLVLLK